MNIEAIVQRTQALPIIQKIELSCLLSSAPRYINMGLVHLQERLATNIDNSLLQLLDEFNKEERFELAGYLAYQILKDLPTHPLPNGKPGGMSRKDDQSIHLVFSDRHQMIIPGKSIDLATMIEGDVFIRSVSGELLASLRGDIARAYWQYELDKCETTITDKPEYYQADISQLDYQQLLILSAIVTDIDFGGGDDADYMPEDIFSHKLLDEYNKLPSELAAHIFQIGRVGRAKFLFEIANALADRALKLEAENQTEITSSDLIDADN